MAMADSDPGKLLLGAGVVTWVVSGAPEIAAWGARRAAFDGRAVVWCAAYAAFAVAFVIATTAGRFGKRGRVAALCVQSVSALAICTLGDSGFEGALLCVVAGEAPLLLGGRAALTWVVAQMAALLAIELATRGNVRGVYFSAGAYAGFQAFTFGASRLAAREAAARQELARVHAELLATQELLADSTRTAERLRIARELHDALGHHLTALSLQLEVARNVVDGRAKAPVEEAHGAHQDPPRRAPHRRLHDARGSPHRPRRCVAHARLRHPAPARASRSPRRALRGPSARAHPLSVRAGGAHQRGPPRRRRQRVPGDRREGRDDLGRRARRRPRRARGDGRTRAHGAARTDRGNGGPGRGLGEPGRGGHVAGALAAPRWRDVIKVALADDQTLVRQGIRSLLELTADIRVVVEACDGEEAITALASTAVDVALLDVRMPKKTGLDVLASLARSPKSPPCILLTTFDDDAVAFQGIKLGARGFLLKDVSLDHLADTIRTVAGGGTVINPAVTERIVRGLARLDAPVPAATVAVALTPRELDVLRLMASGASNKEIADALGTAEATVKNQASSIFLKLGVRDRTRAVLRAIERGVL